MWNLKPQPTCRPHGRGQVPRIADLHDKPQNHTVRYAIASGLLFTHLALVAFAGALPDKIAAAVAGTVYVPLWLFKTIGLPVFKAGASWGWAAPSMLGWLLFTAVWALVWWGLVAAVAKLRR